ncbi:MAG: Rrf2 family transcriptional regulator [Ignavibacteriales bacterium]|jgi:Rrf2 family transcriptional regulator, iron-sulfur cluster assembly transcription factor|nr:Rrf2 family transcriptional regulator [Ignavibacteriales bacterium]MBK7980457.1 Rrf2 family transcriptional regulator [Ignavibacteriota bacterium]
MKFTSQEEYGLRCLVRLGNSYDSGIGLTIPDISNNEGISEDNVAKTLRLLRLNGYLDSERGRNGGYTLTKHPKDILIGDVMNILGGKFFESTYCQIHSPDLVICTHSTDCSIRSFWQLIQKSIDQVMNNLTLQDLLNSEKTVFEETAKKIDLQQAS